MNKPTLHRIRFNSVEYRDDPWTAFARLRESGSVIRLRLPLVGTGWAATTYDLVNTVLRDSERFVRNPKNAGRKRFASIQRFLPRSFSSLVHNMLAADGQQHRRLRSLVDQAFARRQIEQMATRLETLTQQQLDIVAEIAKRDGKVDLIEHYARPVPLTVICELLGLPADDRPKFRKWFAPFSEVTSIFGLLSLNNGLKAICGYLRRQFQEVRKSPREGLITELVRAEHEGQKLNETELLSMSFLLLVAGHETTVHLISNSLLTLMQFPTEKESLMADWSKGDNAIEEVLRYCSPLQMAKPRFVAQDMRFHGQQLRRGEMIFPLLAAANYDPAKFENPDQFDIERHPNNHMSFGSGPHTCLGIKLARSETLYALKCLFQRWPNLQPAFDLDHPDWSQRLATRGLKTLFVKTG